MSMLLVFCGMLACANEAPHQEVLLVHDEPCPMAILAPDGELKHGKLGEEAYKNKADTYGQILMLTRQDIINDAKGFQRRDASPRSRCLRK